MDTQVMKTDEKIREIIYKVLEATEKERSVFEGLFALKDTGLNREKVVELLKLNRMEDDELKQLFQKAKGWYLFGDYDLGLPGEIMRAIDDGIYAFRNFKPFDSWGLGAEKYLPRLKQGLEYFLAKNGILKEIKIEDYKKNGGWVAIISGLDPRYGLERQFLNRDTYVKLGSILEINSGQEKGFYRLAENGLEPLKVSKIEIMKMFKEEYDKKGYLYDKKQFEKNWNL